MNETHQLLCNCWREQQENRQCMKINKSTCYFDWQVYAYRYTRLQTVWSLPDPSRQANKGHSPRWDRRPNGPGRFADKVVQPTTQSAEGCTYEFSHEIAWHVR